MKKLFKKKKKSHSEAGSVADLSNSGYDISPKKDLSKLHRAAFEGDLNKLKSLLKKGDVNEADQEKRTPMHLCCASGKIDAVRMLADEPRINFNMCDKSGRTPLMVCVQCQFHKCLDILLRKGADLSLADDKGNTALHLAVSLPSTEITYLLLDYGIDIHCKNKDDNTPLHIAATVSNSEDVIKTLVADGALVDSRNRSEKTPLMIAASRGYIPVVKQLLQSGADTELKDSNGWTANDLANSNGHHPLSYIIVEHAMKKQGGGSRPQSARQGSAATSSTSMSPVHQQQQRAVAGSRRGSSSAAAAAAAAAAMVGAPAMQQDESSSEDEETSKVMSAVVGNEAGGGDNDLWSVTDEDDNPLFDDDDDHEATDKKPAGGGGGKVNVMQFLRDRQKNKLAMEAPGHTYKEQEMGEEDNEAGSGWSSSSSSTSTSEDLEYTSRKKQQTPSETTVKANPDHQPPPPAAVPQAADSPKPSPRNNFSKWDSTDDDDDDDDAYRPSVAAALPDDTNQAKKDMLSELGFDEDELSATGDEGDDSSQPTPSPPPLHHDPAPAQAAPPPPEPAPAPEIVTPEFEPVTASPAPKPEQVPPKVAAPKPEAPPVETAASSRHDSGEDSSSSDWDSDAEDDESRENFDAGGAVNYVQAADDMKFDDELIISSGDSSDDDDASLISGLDDDSDAPPEDVEVKQENEEERVAVMASPVPVKALTPPISAGLSRARSVSKSSGKGKSVGVKKKRKSAKTSKNDSGYSGEDSKSVGHETARSVAQQICTGADGVDSSDGQVRAVANNFRNLVNYLDNDRKARLGIRERAEKPAAGPMLAKRAYHLNGPAAAGADSSDNEKRWTRKRSWRESAGADKSGSLWSRRRPSTSLLLTRSLMKTRACQADLKAEVRQREKRKISKQCHHLLPRDAKGIQTRNLFEKTYHASPPAKKRKSFAGGYAAADDSSVSSVEENKLMKHQFQTENSKVKGGGSDATATSSEDARSEAPSPQQRHHNDNGAGFPRHHDYHHQANDEWGSNGAMEEREELVACIRKLNFELTALKEREKSHQLEVETEREGAVKCQEDLQVERDNRRKLEVTIRDLKHELQCISQTLNCVEEDRKRLQEELVQSIRQNQVRQKLDKMNDQVEMETQRGSKDALDLMMQEKEQQIAQLTDQRDTLFQNNLRYKQELEELQNSSNADDSTEILTKINTDLNNKIDLLNEEKIEWERVLQHNANSYKHHVDQLQQNLNELNSKLTLETEGRKERWKELEGAKLDCEKLRLRCDELEGKLADERASNKSQLDKLQQQRDEHMRRVHSLELGEATLQHELTNVRTSVTMKENEAAHARTLLDQHKRDCKQLEDDLHQAKIANAALTGKIESLKVEVAQLDGEKLRLKSELDESRTSENVGMSEQQERLNSIISDNTRERIELEKTNASLAQQVTHLREEFEKLAKQKLDKEGELASAHQDRIEQLKKISFTESSMLQLSEQQRALTEERNRLVEKNQQLKQSVDEMSLKAKEEQLEHERGLSNEKMEHKQELDAVRRTLNEKVSFLESTVNTLQTDKISLEAQLAQVRDDNDKHLFLAEKMEAARQEMEEKLNSQSQQLSVKDKQLCDTQDQLRVSKMESSTHRETWEGEVKSRLNLSVQVRKLEQDRDEAIRLCEQYKHRLVASVSEGKTYEAKHSLQRKKIASMREELEHSRLSSMKLQQDDSGDEMGGDRGMVDEVAAAREWEVKKGRMQEQLRDCERKLQQSEVERRNLEKKLHNLYEDRTRDKRVADSSKDEATRQLQDEVDSLRAELERARDAHMTPRHHVMTVTPSQSPSRVNLDEAAKSELNAKLDIVNSFLEDHSIKQENLDRIRRENEESRMRVANQQILELQRQVEVERARNSAVDKSRLDRSVKLQLERSQRDNARLKHTLMRTHKQLGDQARPPPPYMSRSLNFDLSSPAAPSTAPAIARSDSNRNLLLTSSPTRDLLVTSTPTRDNNYHHNNTNLLYTKLDTSLGAALRDLSDNNKSRHYATSSFLAHKKQ